MDQRTSLRVLVDDITKTGSVSLDSAAVKALKGMVRGCDTTMQEAYRLIVERLGDQNSQIRFLALLLVGHLFQRSVAFRTQLSLNFPRFVELTVGLELENPLPPPRNFAALLRERALEFIEAWDADFGHFFPQLRIGFRYLKESRGVQFPDVQSQVVAEQQRTHTQVLASQALCLAKYRQARSQMRDSQCDVEAVLTQLDALFEIVVPKMLSEIEETSARSTHPGPRLTIDALGDHHGLGSAEYELSVEYRPHRIQESVAAAGVKSQIQECLHELITRYEPVVADWTESIAAADVGPREEALREDLLQSANSLKNRIVAAKQKGRHTGLTVPRVDQDDGTVFDEEEEEEMVVVGFGADEVSSAVLNDSAGEPAHQQQRNDKPQLTGSRKRQKSSAPQESVKERIAKKLKKSAKRVARAMANVDAKQTRGLM